MTETFTFNSCNSNVIEERDVKHVNNEKFWKIDLKK